MNLWGTTELLLAGVYEFCYRLAFNLCWGSSLADCLWLRFTVACPVCSRLGTIIGLAASCNSRFA